MSIEVPAAACPEDDVSGADASGLEKAALESEDCPLPPLSPSVTNGAGPAGPSFRLVGFGSKYGLADGGPLKRPAKHPSWTALQYFSHAVQP